MKKTITISISKKFLAEIEKNIEGKTRSEKLEKVCQMGYNILTKKVSV